MSEYGAGKVVLLRAQLLVDDHSRLNATVPAQLALGPTLSMGDEERGRVGRLL